jgi:hypothetical protein
MAHTWSLLLSLRLFEVAGFVGHLVADGFARLLAPLLE